ncbi:hypothetical protein [uncultured Stenotrophomonas sp.]|uniref:hypothetical protein n=1 Tax=uncultured Stenotrophomonas sp. TaxID=165438 RepID=UPI0028E74647|nr:hypothetical protein [uncultured Stenotrophomonas sp.]
MPLFSALSRFTASTTSRRVLAVSTIVVVVLMACNPELAPLAALVDMARLDVLALLLSAQLLATLPRLSDHARRILDPAHRAVVALAAGAMGSYLRQLVCGVAQRTVANNRQFGRSERKMTNSCPIICLLGGGDSQREEPPRRWQQARPAR